MKKSFWQRVKEVFIPPDEDADVVKKQEDVVEKKEEPKQSLFSRFIGLFTPKEKISPIKQTEKKEKVTPIKQTKKKEKEVFVTETKKPTPKKEEEGFKMEFLKDYFREGTITVHDLTSEIKKDRVGRKYYKAKHINKAIRQLKEFRQNQIKPVENALHWGIDPIKNRDELIRLKNAEKAALNQIRKMKGKDFYYAIDTHFKVHKIMRSEILKQGDDNGLFLSLMEKDIKEAIASLKKNKPPGYEERVKILKDKLLPAVEYNQRINSMRDVRIEDIDEELLTEIEMARDVTIANNQKDGKYMIMSEITGESVNLFS